MDDVRKKILDYVADQVRKGRSPSVADMIRRVGTNRKRLYKEFPSGSAEIYRSAGYSAPVQRIASMKNLNPPRERSLDQGVLFDVRLAASGVVAEIEEFRLSFLSETEDSNTEPYWIAQRSRLNDLAHVLVNDLRTTTRIEQVREGRRAFLKFKSEFERIKKIRTLSGDVSELERRRSILSPLVEKAEGLVKDLQMPYDDAIVAVRYSGELYQAGVQMTFLSGLARSLGEARRRGMPPADFAKYVCEHRSAHLELRGLRDSRDMIQIEISHMIDREREASESVAQKEARTDELDGTLRRLKEGLARLTKLGPTLASAYYTGVDHLEDLLINEFVRYLNQQKAIAIRHFPNSDFSEDFSNIEIGLKEFLRGHARKLKRAAVDVGGQMELVVAMLRQAQAPKHTSD